MKRRHLLAAALVLAAPFASAQTPPPNPLVVTKGVDDGTIGTLRYAINFANSLAVTTAGPPTGACPIVTAAPPAITFDTSAGPLLITPATSLPAITCQGTTIDGGGTANNIVANTSTNASIKVTLDGGGCDDHFLARAPREKAGGSCDGLTVSATGVTIRGLAIHSFGVNGINVLTGSANVQGNFVGTDASGRVALGNGTGVNVARGATVYLGGTATAPGDRNLISANTVAGIHVSDGVIDFHLSNSIVGGTRDGGNGGMGNATGVVIDLSSERRYLIADNAIRYNGGPGVLENYGIEIRRNSMYANGRDSISYTTAVVPTPLPTIESFSYDGVANSTTVTVSAPSGTQNPNDVEVFSNPGLSITTLSSFTQGELYAGHGGLTFDSAANLWRGTFTVNGKLDFPTATLTHDRCGDGCAMTTSKYTFPVLPPVAALAFDPPVIASGNPASLLIVVGNPNPMQMRSIQYSFRLPADLQGTDARFDGTDECGTASLLFGENAITLTGLNLLSGQSCTVRVGIAPPASGTHMTSNIDVSSSLGNGSSAAPGVLIVSQPIATASPSAVDFHDVPVGSFVATTVTVKNVGTGNLSFTGMSMAGAGFSVTTDDCSGRSLPPAPPPPSPSTGCTLTVTFFPQTPGVFTGALTITSNGAPLTVPLTGAGVAPALTLTPTSIAFSDLVVGQTASANLTLKNSGNADLSLFQVNLDNTSGTAFSKTASTCAATLAPAASCTITIGFAPTEATSYLAHLDITANLTTSTTVSVPISGNGISTPPAVKLTPAALVFASQAVGTTSAAQTITLTNTGGSPLLLPTTGGIVTSTPDFAVSGCAVVSLAGGASCTLSVTFTPQAIGSRSGILQINDNAAGSPHTAALSGPGVAGTTPALTLSRTSLTFARQGVGTTSGAQTVVLTNSGDLALHITTITISGDFGYTGCGFPLTFAPGESCTFAITFSPLSNGPLTGSVTVTDDANGSPHVIHLSGVGANGPQPSIAVHPFSLDFGDARIGSQHSQTITITSNGSAPLAITSISTTAGDFQQTNACPASLVVGASCDVTVNFTPTALGSRTGRLIVTSNGDPAIFNVALVGNSLAIPPGVLAVDRFVDFGQRVAGTTFRTNLDLRNSGEQPINVTIMEARGTGFALEGFCATIAPAGVCTVTLVFTPPAIGTFTGTLTILSNDARGAIRVDLLGQGIAVPRPEIELSVDGIGFANQFLTTRSPVQRITIRSVGSAPLHVRGISVSGPFELSGSCPSAMAAGTACDVSVSFVPVTAGHSEGRLTVESDAQSGRGFASLTGTGCRFFSVAGMRSLQRLCQ